MTHHDLDNDEISLLDLALTVAENLRLLIIAPSLPASLPWAFQA